MIPLYLYITTLTLSVPFLANPTEEPMALDVPYLDDTTEESGTLDDMPINLPEAKPKCRLFTYGVPSKCSFFSPNYPLHYPNHTDCVKIIEADPGHYIELDFRIKFHIEPSDGCKFDFLEIRDGPNGYDPLIDKFCGDDFPPIIRSSGRYLWLRFMTDGNTEYGGFAAVYKFVKRPDGTEIPDRPCRKELTGIEGFVNSSEIEQYFEDRTEKYGVPLECMWTITVAVGWKIQLNFLKFKLKLPNDCDSNFVDIFPEKTDIPSRMNNFCGSMADMVQSNGNILRIRFVAMPNAVKSTFLALFTAFREKPKGDPTGCEPGEFDCEDATCISEELKCNSNSNCRFRTDEDPMKCHLKEGVLSAILNTEHMIIILIVFFLILTGMCFAFLFNCFRKLIRDHRIIQEHMRRSREARIHEEDVKIPTVFSKRTDCYVPSSEQESLGSNFKSSEVETRDSQVQTRESLFETGSGDGLSGSGGRSSHQQNWFTTFGRGPPDDSDSDGPLRATSIETTKSAPDVILTRH